MKQDKVLLGLRRLRMAGLRCGSGTGSGCTALAVRRRSWIFDIPAKADFEPMVLCERCMHKLTAMYDACSYDGLHPVYEVEPMDCVMMCEKCGDGWDGVLNEVIDYCKAVELRAVKNW